MRISAHSILTWVAGIASTLTATVILSLSGAFFQMRDQLIRMEPIPGIVKEHEQRLDDIDRHPQYFKNNP